MERLNDIICTGPSMEPTLLPGDKIKAREVAFDELRRGDIIVYNSPDNIHINLIHRITGRDSAGFITRGDNNSQTDPGRVRPEHRPLKVIAIGRGSQHLKISSHGMIVHRLRILQKRFRILRRKCLYSIYTSIADSGIFYPFGKMFTAEVRKFKRPGGIEFQLFLGKRRVGTLRPGMGEWHISFPWRLFLKAPEAGEE